MAILNEFIENEVFTESDLSKEKEAPVFNISILDIYKKAEFTNDNNSILSECLNMFIRFRVLLYDLRKMKYYHIVKNDDNFQNILKVNN